MLEIQDLRDFSISTWYSQFENIALKTIILNIPAEILAKFQEGDEEFNLQEVSPEFYNSLKNTLNSLNNNAFFKNNWHAPMDAKMFSFGYSLKLSNIPDLIMLLSVSNILQEDFNNAKGVDLCLAFKPWTNIHPASEFRCIVINNVLRGITSRDWPTFYDHYITDGSQIIEKISNFFHENIRIKFPRQSYVFDVILSYPDKPILLDFGGLNAKTNLYAFSWNEIVPLLKKECPEEVPPIFRYLESDIGIMTKSEALLKVSQSNLTIL